jgi:RNA polymerase sigma-70 factor (sigma-E family)
MMEPVEVRAVSTAESADFEAFFRNEYDHLFQAAFLLTGSRHEADDIAQEALLRAFERWDRVRDMDSPAGYVYRVALNLDRSRMRKVAVRARRIFASVPIDDPSTAVVASQQVLHALANLPRGQREAIVLTGWLGMDAEEAGRVLGIDASSVRGRLHRGRAALRTLLGETDE